MFKFAKPRFLEGRGTDMNWLKNMKTRSKLFLGFGVILVALIVVVGVAIITITDVNKSFSELYKDEFSNSVMLKDFLYDQMKNREAILMAVLEKDEARRDQAIENIYAIRDKNTKELETILDRNINNELIYNKLVQFKSMRDAYSKTRDDEQIPLVRQGQVERAIQISRTVQTPRFQEMAAFVEEIIQQLDQQSKDMLNQVLEESDQAIIEFAVFGIVGILLSVLFVLLLNHLLATPLRIVGDFADRISGNDLNIVVPAYNLRREDEVGQLFNSFDLMIGNLNAMLKEIDDGISVLASSSSEILASTSQVSSGAAETATAISQATTTIEEVRQTSQLSNQKAQKVSEVAKSAESVSIDGKHATEKSVEAILGIRAQMESVAQSIVRLSEQSQSIGEITATVSDLAERSNLLAVNAAIEAAKAGEQGRGFAIVAQEVRSLAEQSKEATRQISKILDDVQKSMSAAVMVTEQGTKSVEIGVERTKDAGESIRALTEKVAESAEAATQIAVSSQQQLIGVDQVASAMENIKLASTQNVASTKQAEQAAKNLHDLGAKLKTLTDKYAFVK